MTMVDLSTGNRCLRCKALEAEPAAEGCKNPLWHWPNYRGEISTDPQTPVEGWKSTGGMLAGKLAPDANGDGPFMRAWRKRQARVAAGEIEEEPQTYQMVPQGFGKPDCPRCKGRGYYRRDRQVGQTGFGHAYPCDEPGCRVAQIGQSTVERGWKSFPTGYEAYTFNTFPGSPDARGLGGSWCRQKPDTGSEECWIWFHGPVGTGKSSLAAACVNDLQAQRARSVIYETVPNLLTRLRATNAPGAVEHDSQLIDELALVEVLVLDDFGAQRPSQYEGESLFQIVNTRNNDKRVTIFTSNKKPTDLAGVSDYMERIMDRVTERALIVPVLEPNIRQWNAARHEVERKLWYEDKDDA